MVRINAAVAAVLGCSLATAAVIGDVSRLPRGLSRGKSQTPTATVKNGTLSGVFSQGYNQDFFLGIPYAQTPERFQLSKSLNSSWSGVREANAYPLHCVGYGGDEVGYEVSEDCLYLNVIRPAGISSTAGLPVAVWIHGGGLIMGGSGDKRYNLSFIVENSVRQGTPLIGVSLNYRLSAFGFLGGKQAQEAGVTNIGFRDQRLALQWVHENIAPFGGAADKVTIWGESSGAESVSAQTFAYNGRDDGLFRGAIAESGFGGVIFRSPGGFNATAVHQAVYDSLVTNTSCSSTVGTAASLDCLRKLPLDELNAVLNTTANANAPSPWPPVLDGDFIADYPHNQLRDGRFPQVPVLIGCNSDEGTAVASRDIDSDAELRSTLASKYGLDGRSSIAGASTLEKAEHLLDELLRVYPDIQAVGLPPLDLFPTIQPGDDNASALGLQFRRAAALIGDVWMHYQRRRANLAWSAHGVPSWSYRFNVLVNGVPATTGATHFQEVAFVFNNLNGVGYTTNPFENEPYSYVALSEAMSSAWINFVTGLDPNGVSGYGGSQSQKQLPGSVAWPAYNATVGGGAGSNIVWRVNGSYVEPDTYRAEGISWLISHGLDIFGV